VSLQGEPRTVAEARAYAARSRSRRPSAHRSAAELAEELERRLLGGARTLRRRQVSSSAGVSLVAARKLWRALGFPAVEDRDVAFTEADRESLHRVVEMVRSGRLDEETAIGLVRAFGHTADRLVSWQTEALFERAVRTAGVDEPAARELVLADLADMVDDLERLLVYSWRRQLAAAVGRMAAQSVGEGSDAEHVEDAGSGALREVTSPAAVTVCFADLVSFTRLSQRLDEQRLSELVQRFEAKASEVITEGGGRVVKTVGDEVLFVVSDPTPAARTCLTMAEVMTADRLLPQVRVGMVHGPVLSRLGDVFGSTVNLASRLTAMAQPGTVLTDSVTGAGLEDSEEFEVLPQRRRHVRGVGQVRPVMIARPEPRDLA
jgi:adenylate cyclase